MPERACHCIGVCVCVCAGGLACVCVWVASGESAPLSVVCAVLVPFVKFQRRTQTQTWVCVIGYAVRHRSFAPSYSHKWSFGRMQVSLGCGRMGV